MNLLSKYLVENLLGKKVAAYGGGFKPVSAGHFLVVKEALKKLPNVDEFIIYVGSGVRDGITQQQSIQIWEIYKKYLDQNIKIEGVNIPIRSIYDLAKENPGLEITWVLGMREGDENDQLDIAKRTKAISTNKYPNLKSLNITTTGSYSGTKARAAINQGKDEFLKFIPTELSDEDKDKVWDIVSKKELNEGLTDHAQEELKIAGLFDKDSDYEGMIGEAVLELIQTMAKQGHSGFSAGMVRELFNKLSNYETLTPITENPDEWMDVNDYCKDIEKGTLYQSKRNPAIFSKDGLKTWYHVDGKSLEEGIKKGLIAYLILEDKIPGGLAQGKTLEDIARHHDPKGYYDVENLIPELTLQLEKGIKIEMEHTTDFEIAKEIAIDHLWEDSKYYDKLKKAELKENKNNLGFKKYINYLDEILEYCCDDLGIPRPKVKIINNEKYTQENKSFGAYKPGKHEIDIVIKNRVCSDVGRTLSHEIRHFKQDLDGVLNEQSGKDGSEHENECNAYSGTIMRHFNRKYPEILTLKND